MNKTKPVIHYFQLNILFHKEICHITDVKYIVNVVSCFM